VEEYHTSGELPNTQLQGDLSGMRLFDVSFYHSVKLPAGITGLPSPGDIVRTSRLISRNETKRSCIGSVNMTHHKAALPGATCVMREGNSAVALRAYGGPRKSAACQGVARRAKPEGHSSQMPDVDCQSSILDTAKE
jgi:hypothetical protein